MALTNHRTRRPIDQAGIGLIEVLVSVFILGVGLLAIAAMQAHALRAGQSSLEGTQAVLQANSIIEAIRADRINATSYNTAGPICEVSQAGTLAQTTIAAWVTTLKATMGAGPQSVETDTTTCGQILNCPDCEISIIWNDTRAGGSATKQFVTRSRL